MIKALVNKLCCCHKWELLDKYRYFENGSKLPWGGYDLYTCTKCGKIKKIEINL